MTEHLLVAIAVGMSVALPWLVVFGIEWWQERRWRRFVDRWADVAHRDPSALSVLDACPDLSRLTVRKWVGKR
jgi:hypothetical protein